MVIAIVARWSLDIWTSWYLSIWTWSVFAHLDHVSKRTSGPSVGKSKIRDGFQTIWAINLLGIISPSTESLSILLWAWELGEPRHQVSLGIKRAWASSEPGHQASLGIKWARDGSIPSIVGSDDPRGWRPLLTVQGAVTDHSAQHTARFSPLDLLLQWRRVQENQEAAHDGKEGLKVIHDIVYKGDFLFVPPPKGYDIVRAAHESNMNPHPGILATVSKLKENYWWPKMRDDVEHLISQCMACRTQKPDRSPP